MRELATLQRKLNKAANFNRRKNIRLVNWNNATWQIDGSGRAYNTPTLGSELLTDGGFENWSSATNLTSWTEVASGLSVIDQETTVVNSGIAAARISVDASNSIAYIRQAVAATIGAWIAYSAHLSTNVNARSVRIDLAGTTQASGPTIALTLAYQRYNQSARAISGTLTLDIIRAVMTSASYYVDDTSIKTISLPTTLATVAGSTNNLTVAAKINTIITATQVGVASLIDSSSNPQNFIIAYHDGTNVRLEKCVAGVYTQLISTAVTFVTNAQIEIRRPSGNTFQLWYNGTQRGTDQTISDSEIINNNLYGIFSTYSGNLISEFTLGGVVIPFTF